MIGLGSHEGFVPQRFDPPRALSWLPINLGYEERELLDHFICTAPSTLAIFEPDKNEFLSLLVRLVLSDSSPSSVAVLQSALALSLFHRHGLQADVYRFKARVLRTLITSCNPSIESPTLVQHVAARMILCHLEMLEMTNNGSLWYCHLVEAKYLIDNAGVDSQYCYGGFSRLVAWVDYHIVMSRFSLRHWHLKVEPVEEIRDSTPVEPETCLSRKVKGVSYYSHEILRHLYITFEIIQTPTNSLYHSDEYENFLRCLESKITDIVPSALEGISDTVSGLNTAWMAMTELFKLAGLIYLKRASRNFSGISSQIDTMVERAYLLLDELGTFNPTFPLLIVGFEARTDKQRMRILEHIERAMASSSLRSLHGLRNILQQTWVQDDLAMDYELDYLHKLDAVIGSYRILPSFA
ncbi:hypothetical protein K505DRAFT_242555 [Melanomma pulvis-pyrius CBS 109.77]|uniref:Transcription factor domain-containing protein n=1 Tax=Melanomma pulvis-pyrius CBS 109.77 TaxID=1314802 RepID=A0A6A6XDQ2_9PLEO|nr:hypothetical protein K505DRAFT_242555 [Melanomma pulvis-pyrius CBS 109.77]